MGLDNRLNGSAVKIWTALSHIVHSSGSGGASNFAGFEFATAIIATGSADSGLKLSFERSGTSDGTFASFGASFPTIQSGASGSGITYVRSFSLDSSAAWYRLVYDKLGLGDTEAKVVMLLQGARNIPITQDTGYGTRIYSDVIGG
jgi:hypothetical protein